MSKSGSLVREYTEFINWACASFYTYEETRNPGLNTKPAILPRIIRAIGLGWIAVLRPAYSYSAYGNILIFSDWGTTKSYYEKICAYVGATEVSPRSARQSFGMTVRLLAALPGIVKQVIQTRKATWLAKDVQAATWSFIRAHIILRDAPEAIVVLSQHSVTSRALIWVARKKNIRVIYLPHAPTATNVMYHDMPVHVAGLWSYRDQSIYRDLAASPAAGLLVLGNPTLQSKQLTEIRQQPESGRYIFAPSPHAADNLVRQIKLINEFQLTKLDVCMHPRMDDRVMAGLLSEHLSCSFEFQRDRVADLSGVGDVILCCSSGVALDGLKNGSLIVDLTAPNVRLNYHYLEDDIIMQYRNLSLTQIREKITAVRSDPSQYLIAARTFFDNWMSYTDEDALIRIKEMLDSPQLSNEIIYDRWMKE